MKPTIPLFALILLPTAAAAQSAPPQSNLSDDGTGAAPTAPAATDRVLTELPFVAYAYGATGASVKTIGVQAFGLGLAARGQDAMLGGGGAVWGSPMDRLTLVGDARRTISRNFSPSVAVIVRLLGDGHDGFTLGALGKFKVDGFSGGPQNDEIESEIEVGGLLSYAKVGWYVDVNAIAGRGTGDDGETDTEARLRLGRDITSWLRLGVDGQGRVRLSGTQGLPNGKTWDFATGLQAITYSGNIFGALTAGPATMGLLSENVGWTTMVTIGGATL